MKENVLNDLLMAPESNEKQELTVSDVLNESTKSD